ncbi:putative elongation factor 1-delta [Pseudolycoriella hygida]|uniref:Elongation factor 1-delta n=1 Tax=Pseudolycoriella hygida TaxID=35572 RepID=A0A9Q0N4L4_9DIPT|nr:putative elongation factor 1-delta [Pseudolycoriella hygida]
MPTIFLSRLFFSSNWILSFHFYNKFKKQDTMAACPLAAERVWIEKSQYQDAEQKYFEHLSKLLKGSSNSNMEETPTESNLAKSPECPFQAVLETFTASKPKKQRKSKKSTKEDSSVSEDLPIQTERKVIDVEIKPKDNKEKRSKAEKKKLAANCIDADDKSQAGGECTLVTEIAKARQHIKNSLERMDGIAALASTPGKEVLDRISSLEKENISLRDIVEQLRQTALDAADRIKNLESRLQSLSLDNKGPAQAAPAPAAAAANNNKSDDDDGVDLFGSDSDDEDDAAAKIREQRLAEYAAKKSKKPALIAKSNVILDVKPWDDETDMKLMEQEVRKIATDGLLWGAAKLVPLAFGIHKLSISCVVEDDKVSIDWLTEEIEKNEDLVQSVDVAAFNKI